MDHFRIGDVVSFNTDDGNVITGILVRKNKKMVTIHTGSGYNWNVPPLRLKIPKQQFPLE